MLKEFKAFIMRGNVVDLAVGVIIGAAFGAIVSSLVKDVLMPPLGLMMGSMDFSNSFIALNEKARVYTETVTDPAGAKTAVIHPITTLAELDKYGGAAIRYGAFITAVINFLLVALAIFIVIKLVHRLMPPPPPPAPATKDCPQCAMPVPIKAVKCGHCQSAL